MELQRLVKADFKHKYIHVYVHTDIFHGHNLTPEDSLHMRKLLLGRVTDCLQKRLRTCGAFRLPCGVNVGICECKVIASSITAILANKVRNCVNAKPKISN